MSVSLLKSCAWPAVHNKHNASYILSDTLVNVDEVEYLAKRMGSVDNTILQIAPFKRIFIITCKLKVAVHSRLLLYADLYFWLNAIIVIR